jgi:hypothetical protein
MEQIDQHSSEHKILIFSQFVSMLDLIKHQLDAREVKYEYLTGKTKDRAERVKQFQEDEETRVFLISMKAGGTGLNLTEADYVFIVDPWWNPAVENQAIDRCYRIGQKKNVMAIRLICPDTIEQKIMQLQENKKELIDDLTEEFFEFYSNTDERSKVLEYGHYFMGSIVLTADDNAIIDGQQRLTSLTLLLIYLYHQLEDEEERAEVLQLIYSKKAGTKTFNIHVPEMPERYDVMNALLQDQYMDVSKHAETIRNIYNRYSDIKAIMNDTLPNEALAIFKDWLIDNVDFIRIVAQTEQDAHKIFVSMNIKN